MLMLAKPLIVVVAYPTFCVNPTHHVIQGAMAAFRSKKGKKGKTRAQQLYAMRRKRRASERKHKAAMQAELARRQAEANARGEGGAKKKKT